MRHSSVGPTSPFAGDLPAPAGLSFLGAMELERGFCEYLVTSGAEVERGVCSPLFLPRVLGEHWVKE